MGGALAALLSADQHKLVKRTAKFFASGTQLKTRDALIKSRPSLTLAENNLLRSGDSGGAETIKKYQRLNCPCCFASRKRRISQRCSHSSRGK
jgi:hypothetical protein